MAPFCLPGPRPSLRLGIRDIISWILLLLPTGLLRRDFGAGAAGLGKAYGDRLLAALHLASRAATAQRAALALVHRFLDFALGLLPVACHGDCSGSGWGQVISRKRAPCGSSCSPLTSFRPRRMA